MYICSLAYVGLLAIWDVWKKMVPAIALCLGGVMGLFYSIYAVSVGSRSVFEIGLALCPGAILLLLAYATRQQIGYGDGILLLILGLLLGKEAVIFILVVGQLMASGFGIFLLVLRRAGKGATMAYIPFLFAAMLLYRMVAV